MLPGPARRISREPFTLLVALLAIGVAVTAGMVSDRTTIRIASELDEHWRGAYDILVEPDEMARDAHGTRGLVEADFLGFGGRGGISSGEVAEIARLPGVEVAAPVAMIGSVRYLAAYPSLVSTSLPDRPTLYRIEAALETSDGLQSIALATVSGRLLLGPDGSFEGFVEWATDLGDLASSGRDAEVTLAGLELSISSPILAVDPVAEAQLLGDGGAFLAPLAALSNRARLDEGHFDPTLIPDSFVIDRIDLASSTGPVVPVLVSDHTYADLRIRLSVSQVGEPFDEMPRAESMAARLAAAEGLAGDGLTSLGSTSLDLSAIAVPYSPTVATVAWPGSVGPTDAGISLRAIDDVHAVIAERPTYLEQMSPDEAVGLRIEPVPGAGAVAAYRRLRTVPLDLPGGGSDPAVERRFRIAPLGTFDLGTVLPRSDPLSYVPFGAYDPPQTMLFADPLGSPLPETSITPTTDPAGLVVPPPLVITDIPAARLMRGARPIDAVRVRVAGIAGYDDAGRQRVEEVASRIRAMGLAVTVVAGASPQEVSIYVPSYGTRGAARSDLGWVHQWWTSLGVATRVERTVARTSSSLLVLAAVTVGAGLLALGLARFDRRRRQVIILGAVGWSRRRIAGWYAAEGVVVALVAAGLGALAVILAGASTGAQAVVIAVVVALAGGAAVEATLVIRSRATPSRVGALASAVRAHGPISIGFRAAFSRLAWTGTEAVLAAVAAIAIGVAVTLLADFAPSLGASRLGTYATGIASAPEVVLAAVAVGGSILVLAALVLAGVDARADDWRALRANGWTRRLTGLAVSFEQLVVVAPAAVVTLLIAPVVAPIPSLTSLTIGVALVAVPVVGLVAAVVAVLAQRRVTMA